MVGYAPSAAATLRALPHISHETIHSLRLRIPRAHQPETVAPRIEAPALPPQPLRRARWKPYEHGVALHRRHGLNAGLLGEAVPQPPRHGVGVPRIPKPRAALQEAHP